MTIMTEDRVAIMRKALEHVVAHPEEWDQSSWGFRRYVVASDAFDAFVGAIAETTNAGRAPACRTSFCLAGHVAVTVAGARPVWSGNGLDTVEVVDEAGDRTYHSVASYATELLGLTEVSGAATALFSGVNSLRRLAELCYLYSAGRVDLLDALPAPTERDAESEEADYQQALGRYRSLVLLYERWRWRGRALPSLAAWLDARVGPGRRVASC